MASAAKTEGLDLKKAVSLASEFIRWLEKENLLPGPIEGLSLEGFTQNSDGDWLITLGYRIPSPFDKMLNAGSLAGLKTQRPDFYKTLTVHHGSGKVTAMSPHEPQRD
jgi:hypothetical protein